MGEWGVCSKIFSMVQIDSLVILCLKNAAVHSTHFDPDSSFVEFVMYIKQHSYLIMQDDCPY